jgi:hypothetical protein
MRTIPRRRRTTRPTLSALPPSLEQTTARRAALGRTLRRLRCPATGAAPTAASTSSSPTRRSRRDQRRLLTRTVEGDPVIAAVGRRRATSHPCLRGAPEAAVAHDHQRPSPPPARREEVAGKRRVPVWNLDSLTGPGISTTVRSQPARWRTTPRADDSPPTSARSGAAPPRNPSRAESTPARSPAARAGGGAHLRPDPAGRSEPLQHPSVGVAVVDAARRGEYLADV